MEWYGNLVSWEFNVPIKKIAWDCEVVGNYLGNGKEFDEPNLSGRLKRVFFLSQNLALMSLNISSM
jgi:hypothetical protein